MLKNAFDSLTDAKKQLVEGVNTNTKKILTDLLAIAKTYKEADYTAESWRKLTAAVNLLTEASENKSTSLADANAAIKAFQDALKGGSIKMLVFNTQEANSTTDQITGAAKSANVPIVELTEQMPKEYTNLLDWMSALVDQFAKA